MKKIVYIILIIFFMFFVSADYIKAIDTNTHNYKIEFKTPNLDFNTDKQTCSQILGSNLTEVVRVGIKLIQVAGAIIAIVNGMLALIPAVLAKDADGLQKASKKIVNMVIILAAIFILPSIIKLIGNLFSYDVTCFF